MQARLASQAILKGSVANVSKLKTVSDKVNVVLRCEIATYI